MNTAVSATLVEREMQRISTKLAHRRSCYECRRTLLHLLVDGPQRGRILWSNSARQCRECAFPESADRLPSRVEEYVAAHVKLTPQERKTLGEGNPVTKLLGTDESEEVAVFGAIWIGAPIRRYVDAVIDIENFERGGGFTVTKRISSPPRLEDFAQLRLSADDVEDLRSCRVGDCEVKFGKEALERLQKNVNWGSAKARDEANAIAQQLALGYVTSYLEGGNERLAVYRDQSRPTFVAQEFRLMVDKMPELTVYMPEVRDLLETPR